MTISRVRTELTGPQIVGGGVTDIWFGALGVGDEDDALDQVRDFWVVLAPTLRTGNAALVQADIHDFNETTGALTGIRTGSPAPAVVNFTSTSAALPPATQGLIQWRTSGIVANRQVRGRTFIPAVVEGASTNGAPNTDAIAAWGTAAGNLISDNSYVTSVWSRPTDSRPGSMHTVQAVTIWSKFATLRSRRD